VNLTATGAVYNHSKKLTIRRQLNATGKLENPDGKPQD
jgi:hypothetical protein